MRKGREGNPVALRTTKGLHEEWAKGASEAEKATKDEGWEGKASEAG